MRGCGDAGVELVQEGLQVGYTETSAEKSVWRLYLPCDGDSSGDFCGGFT